MKTYRWFYETRNVITEHGGSSTQQSVFTTSCKSFKLKLFDLQIEHFIVKCAQ